MDQTPRQIIFLPPIFQTMMINPESDIIETSFNEQEKQLTSCAYGSMYCSNKSLLPRIYIPSNCWY